MTADQCTACLDHLAAAEAVMETAVDLAGLARLAFVIDCLRAEYGLPARTVAGLDLDFDRHYSAA